MPKTDTNTLFLQELQKILDTNPEQIESSLFLSFFRKKTLSSNKTGEKERERVKVKSFEQCGILIGYVIYGF